MYPHPIALSTEIVHVAIHLSVLVTKTKPTAIGTVLLRPHKLKSTFLENSADFKLIYFFLYLYNVPTLYLSAYEAKKRNEKQEEERV